MRWPFVSRRRFDAVMREREAASLALTESRCEASADGGRVRLFDDLLRDSLKILTHLNNGIVEPQRVEREVKWIKAALAAHGVRERDANKRQAQRDAESMR